MATTPHGLSIAVAWWFRFRGGADDWCWSKAVTMKQDEDVKVERGGAEHYGRDRHRFTAKVRLGVGGKR
ncbi:hypothetical protein Bca4012_038630 [Brassica carinata]|uniref:Uncharacterized protein n=1 Tax=Brassica carinata TaxID=52824 RepID=A0A8X7QDK0_BRACI|nr:hypothetical protein Bca52824_061912 [Brassica carinata]